MDQDNPTNALALPGVYVPRSVIDELDRCLPALYGLIEAAISIIEVELPEGSEKRLICSGLVAWYFHVYTALNNARLLYLTSSKVVTARRASEYMHDLFAKGGHRERT